MVAKTVLITGCSDNGLGAALALEYHKRNHRVFATARNLLKMEQVKSQGIETIQLDTCDASSIADAVATVSHLTNGTLDVLVNNAGVGLSMPIADLDINEVRKLFDTNVFSQISVTQAFLPLLMKSDAVGGALIVNQTSAGSMFGMPFQGAYSASKAAASVLTETLRRELMPFNVRVVELKTGIVKTPFFENVARRGTGPNLPETSLYACAREEVEATMKGDQFLSGAPEANKWAKEVVDDLSATSLPPRLWRGGEAMLIWLLTSLPIPSTWFDNVVSEKSGLSKVVEAIKKKKQI